MILDQVKKTIKDNKLFKKGEKIIIGVSSGPDSICLLDLMNKLKKEYNWSLYILHINHNLRREECFKDQNFVQNLARKLNLPFLIKKIDVCSYRQKYKLSLEEAARELRHQVFAQVCRDKNIKKIALAHTASDQVETILMNFLRGTMIKGLAGMDYQKDFNISINKKSFKFKIIRPLLDCFRQEVLQYLKENNLKFRLDKTNFDLNFTRNRIRHLLIPTLKKVNPSFEKNILTQALLFRFLNKEIMNKVKKITKLSYIDKNKIEFDLKKWQNLDNFYKREVLLNLIKNFSLLKNISRIHIEEIVYLLENSLVGSYKILFNNLVVYKNYDKLIISYFDFLFNKTKIKKKEIKIPGTTIIKEIQAKIETKLVKKQTKANNNKIFVDYDKINRKIFVRSRKAGDYFQPNNFKGNKKIQDFFTDKKIPKFIRNQIPILVNDKDQIIWLCGLRQDKRFMINNKTKNILEIKFNRI